MSFSISLFRSYIESIAERHVSIRHTSKRPRFYELGIEEILQGSLSQVPNNDFILILEPIESAFIGQDPDKQIRVRRAAFIVAKSCAIQNFTAIGQAYQECETIGDDIIRKMNQEAEDASNGDPVIDSAEGIIQFDDSSVENMAVGPILLKSYGMRYTFDILEKFDMLDQDENKWL